MKSHTKQQHYIPNKCYLDYFADKSFKKPSLWVYMDKKKFIDNSEILNPIPISPDNFCKQHLFYETSKLPVNTIENFLNNLEGHYKQVVDKKIMHKKKLNKNDKQKVAYFLSTLEVRTPLNKKSLNDFVSQLRERASHLEEIHNKGEKSEFSKQLDELESSNQMFINLILAAVQVNRFGFNDMLFLSPSFDDEESFFITSDFPVTMYDFTSMNSFYGITPMDTTVEVVIPLTPKIALFANNIGLNGYRNIDVNFVNEVNNRTIRRSNKYIISPKKLSPEFIMRTVKRDPQSFVLWSMTDSLTDQRKKLHIRLMKKSISKVISNIFLAVPKIFELAKFEEVANMKKITVITSNENDFQWYLTNLELIAKKVNQSGGEHEYRLYKNMLTPYGELNEITVQNPVPGATLVGKVNMHINSVAALETKVLKDEQYSLIKHSGKINQIDLKVDRYNLLVSFTDD